MRIQEITQEQKQTIEKAFSLLRDTKDFCILLNYCQGLIYSEIHVNFNEYRLRTLAHPNSINRYKTFKIRKKKDFFIRVAPFARGQSVLLPGAIWIVTARAS